MASHDLEVQQAIVEPESTKNGDNLNDSNRIDSTVQPTEADLGDFESVDAYEQIADVQGKPSFIVKKLLVKRPKPFPVMAAVKEVPLNDGAEVATQTENVTTEIEHSSRPNPESLLGSIKAADTSSTNSDPWDVQMMKMQWRSGTLEVPVGVPFQCVEAYLKGIPEHLVCTAIEDKAWIRKIVDDPKATFDDACNQIRTKQQQRRKDNRRQITIPEEAKTNLKTINDLRKYMTETSGRGKVWPLKGTPQSRTNG